MFGRLGSENYDHQARVRLLNRRAPPAAGGSGRFSGEFTFGARCGSLYLLDPEAWLLRNVTYYSHTCKVLYAVRPGLNDMPWLKPYSPLNSH